MRKDNFEFRQTTGEESLVLKPVETNCVKRWTGRADAFFTGCLDNRGTHVTANNSPNNNAVYFLFQI